MPGRETFLPRIYDTKKLTTKSDPRLLVTVVNNLRKILEGRGKSSAPIPKSTRDFFANILKRGEG